jgi:hypothetical protein
MEAAAFSRGDTLPVRIDLNLVVTLEVVEHHGAAPAQDKYSDDDITEHAEIVVGGADRTRDAAAVAETKLIGLTAPRSAI